MGQEFGAVARHSVLLWVINTPMFKHLLDKMIPMFIWALHIISCYTVYNHGRCNGFEKSDCLII